MAKKKMHVEGATLKAYADFELLGKVYEAGAVFVAPAGYERDLQFEELRNLDRPKGAAIGLAFSYKVPSPIKGEDAEVKRVILPLEEA